MTVPPKVRFRSQEYLSATRPRVTVGGVAGDVLG